MSGTSLLFTQLHCDKAKKQEIVVFPSIYPKFIIHKKKFKKIYKNG
jgi:hypothetical protein